MKKILFACALMIVSAAFAAPAVVFIGDETVANFPKSGSGEWYKYFKQTPFEAICLGKAGDGVEEALANVRGEEFQKLRPKAVVISVGANDLEKGKCSFDVLFGIREIIRGIQKKDTMIRIFLTPLFPQGRHANDPLRARAEVINRELPRYCNGRNVILVDCTDCLLTADGGLPVAMSNDAKLPSHLAYDVWGSALLPYLDAAFEGRRIPGSRFARPNAQRLPVDTPAPLAECGRFGMHSSRFGSDWWTERVARNRRLGAAAGTVDLVMLGDSITHFLERQSPEFGSNVLARVSGEYTVLDCGDAGDMTQHLLWRVRHGELDGYRAKLITLMIGTNNAHAGDNPKDTAAAIRAILDEIARRQPQAVTVLMPIFPRGKCNDKYRAINSKVNALIRPFADGQRVVWLDVSSQLVDANGDVPVELAGDRLHPTEKGYEIIFAALDPLLKKYAKAK